MHNAKLMTSLKILSASGTFKWFKMARCILKTSQFIEMVHSNDMKLNLASDVEQFVRDYNFLMMEFIKMVSVQ